jgi:hemoglobin/transferrin/lactoferrin receptor protein
MQTLARLTTLGLAAVYVASAQVPSSSANLPPVRLPTFVVTPTGAEADTLELPFSIDILDQQSIQKRTLARTLPESLREFPSVMTQKTAHGQGSPYLRGFTGFRTLMLIDGVRLNNSTYREGPNQYWNTVDALALRKLELVKGPASILYSSDAIGGAVNVFTSGRDQLTADSGWYGRAYYRHATAEHSDVGRIEVSGNLGREVGALAGYSEKRFGDLRSGDGTGQQPRTGYRERASDAKLEYFLGPSARLVAAYQGLRQDDAWRTHRTIFGVPWHGATIGNDRKLALDQQRDLAYVQYHQTAIGGAIDTLHLSASFHRQNEREDRVRSTGVENLQGVEVGTVGLSALFESPSPFGRWSYGAEYYGDDVNSFRRNYRADGSLQSVDVQGPVANDARYHLAGAFVQNYIRATDHCDLIFGLRHTRAKADARRVQDPVTGAATSVARSWDANVGSARATWKMDGAALWRLFGGVSQGFRAPNLSDLTRFDIARSGELEVPTTGLSPERFTQYEVGLKVQSRYAGAQAAYFHTRITNMIDRLPADDPATRGVTEVMKANVGRGYVHGLELSGQVELDRAWLLWGNFTLMRGDVDSYVSSAPAVIRRRPLSRVMPATANLGIRWTELSRKYWSELGATFAAAQRRLSPGDESDTQRIPPGGTPGYSVVYLRAGWSLTKHLSVSASLDNVTDKNYRIHGSGLNEPGRNLVLAADVRL